MDTTCSNCGNSHQNKPILKLNEEFNGVTLQEHQIEKHICQKCLSNNEQYKECFYCGDELIYPVQMLTQDPLSDIYECEEHEGETANYRTEDYE